MGYVVTFEDYVPVPRYDGLPWIQAKIEESASPDTGWTQIELLALSPLDPDPTNPLPRTFTTENASLEQGWYKITFLDADGDMQPTAPVWNSPDIANYVPTTRDVARLLRVRTVDNTGDQQGEFTANTTPKEEEVDDLIAAAKDELLAPVGLVIPFTLHASLAHMVVIKTAMLIELGYYPEQIRSNKSPYPELYALLYGPDGKSGLYGRWLEEFEELTASEEGVITAGMPQWAFPGPPDYLW